MQSTVNEWLIYWKQYNKIGHGWISGIESPPRAEISPSSWNEN